MKKITTFLTFALIAFSASSQCTIDQSNTDFLSPRPDSLSCVERDVYYEQVFQFAIPASINLSDFIPNIPFPYILNIEEVVIDSVTGLPDGISYVSNPSDGVLPGGQKGCALLSGITNDPAGDYPINFSGYITVRGFPIPGIFDGDTTFDFSVLQNMGGGGGFGPGQVSVKVIEPGDPCREALGIDKMNPELQSALQVYPNPSNGLVNFEVRNMRLNSMEIEVYDFTGRRVFAEIFSLNGGLNKQMNFADLPKGMYAVLLKTDAGIASKNLVLE